MAGRPAADAAGAAPPAAPNDRWHRRVYEKKGARYPRTVVAGSLALLHVVSLGATAVAALYVPMSVRDFVALALVSQLLWGLTNLLTWLRVRPEVRALEGWLADRKPEHEAPAREAAMALPLATPLGPQTVLVAAMAALAWDASAAFTLRLNLGSAAAFFAGSVVAYMYWALLAFLEMEAGFRPVLEEFSSADSERSRPRARLSLRRRLMLSLPAINLITGVVVAGVLPADGSGATGLAVGIATAAVVTVTVSLWLTGLLASSVATPVSALRETAIRLGHGDLSARAPLIGTDEIADLARTLNAMAAGLQQRERLREAFGTFMDPVLAERVLRDGVDLDGEEVEASVMFVDIHGFTAYAERAAPREAVALLNRVFDAAVPIILQNGGHANKFVGDGLLAVFGAPDRQPDHARCAVAAALEIVDRIALEFRGDVAVGIGIHSGPVVIGTVGGGGRLDFTVIGDTVNTAARVEAATRETGDTVLITEAVRARVEADPTWPQRVVSLKGKSAPARLFAPAARTVRRGPDDGRAASAPPV